MCTAKWQHCVFFRRSTKQCPCRAKHGDSEHREAVIISTMMRRLSINGKLIQKGSSLRSLCFVYTSPNTTMFILRYYLRQTPAPSPSLLPDLEYPPKNRTFERAAPVNAITRLRKGISFLAVLLFPPRLFYLTGSSSGPHMSSERRKRHVEERNNVAIFIHPSRTSVISPVKGWGGFALLSAVYSPARCSSHRFLAFHQAPCIDTSRQDHASAASSLSH